MGVSVTDNERKGPDAGLTDGRCSGLRGGQGPGERLYLAGWEVRARENRLIKAGHQINLEPKVMDVLLCLAAARGETLSRDELLNSVWPDTFVGDDSLHRAVSLLRRSLSVEPAFEKAVITVPRRGYRLRADLIEAVPDVVMPGTGKPPHPHLLPRLVAHFRACPIRYMSVAGAVLAVGALAWAMSGSPPADPAESSVRTYPFTGFEGQERAASFAPDGEKAVFSWAGDKGDNWDLYVKSVSGWEPERLTTDPASDFNAGWSPDGARIAFVRISQEDGCRIMLVGADGSDEQNLRGCLAGGDTDIAWSPNSRTLYFTDRVGRDGPIAVHTLDLETGSERQITFPPTDYWGDTLVRASPDGKKIAFARTRALGVTDVFVAPLGGGPVRRLTDDRLKIHGLSWNPSSTEVYFSSNRGGTFGLWRVGVNGGGPQAVTVGGVNADSVTVSPDGGRLLYEAETTSSQLWAVALEAGERVPVSALSRASGWNWHPQISPDGARVAFVSDRSGSPELWLANIDGTSPRKLTDFGGAYTNSPFWSPDGSALLLAVPVGGNFDIYRVNAETGGAERLTRHPGVDRSPTWSPDGSTIYFGSNRTGRWEIWAHDLASGAKRQVTEKGGFRGLETAGGQLLFVKRETSGLFALDLGTDGKEERLVTDRLLPLDWNNWHVVGNQVFLIVRDAEINAWLAQLDLETDELTVIRTLPSFPHYSGLAVSPDGSRALFTRTDKVEADLMVLEGFARR